MKLLSRSETIGMSVKKQIEYVNWNWTIIGSIVNPCKEAQLIAIKKDREGALARIKKVHPDIVRDMDLKEQLSKI